MKRSDGDAAVAPLSVDADLDVAVDGTTARVTSTGDRVFVAFGSIAAAVRAARAVPLRERTALHETLRTTGLTLELRVRHRTVATLGSGSKPGIASRALGVSPASVRVEAVAASLGGELGALLDHVRRFGAEEP